MGGIGRSLARGLEGGSEWAAVIVVIGLMVAFYLWLRVRSERREEAAAVARREIDELETYDGWRKAKRKAAWEKKPEGLVGWVKFLAMLAVLVGMVYAVVVVLFIIPLTS